MIKSRSSPTQLLFQGKGEPARLIHVAYRSHAATGSRRLKETEEADV
jgi:hypothetical protein